MKKIILLTVLLLGFITQKSNAQSTTNANTYGPTYYLGWNNTSTPYYDLPFSTNNLTTIPMLLQNTTGYLGLGTTTPPQQLSILGGNVDIMTSTKGLMLAGSYVIRHNGDITCIYVGIGAGNATSSGSYNTFEGNLSGNVNATGSNNTFTGSSAGPVNTSGSDNTFSGFTTGFNNTTGIENSFFGSQCGYENTTGNYNTFGGYYAGFSNTTGSWNTIVGFQCGEHNTIGLGNSFYGKEAGLSNTSGNKNTFIGAHSSTGNTIGDSSVVVGFAAENANPRSIQNVIMGFEADYNGGYNGRIAVPSNYNVLIGTLCTPSHQTGDSNVVAGAFADLVDGIGNSVAIGATAKATSRDKIILGNNRQFTGIGLSNDATANLGPAWNLEICTENNPTYHLPGLGGGTATALNPYGGKGFSGLKFRDLTSFSTPVSATGPFWNVQNPYPKGVLSVDGFGNVIYIPTCCDSGSLISGYTLGSCCNPVYYPAPGSVCNNDPTIDLMSANAGTYYHNLWVIGNQSQRLNNTDVFIGYTCQQPGPAKLSVLQNSGALPSSTSSIGFYVENDDLQYGNTAASAPVYGIYSYIPNPSGNAQSVAGYFEADGGIGFDNNAIIVPPNGGLVGINTSTPTANLEVDGSIYNYGSTSVTLSPTGGNIAIGATSSQTISGSDEYGIMAGSSGTLSSGYTSVGVFGAAAGYGSGTSNIGIYGYAIVNATDYGGFFDGNIGTTGGSFSGSGYVYASDSSIKSKVTSFSNASAIIARLKPRTYYFDTNNVYSLRLDTFKHYGFIAQDIQQVVPCLVHPIVIPKRLDPKGNVIAQSATIKALDYGQFAAIFAQGMQEQQQTIDSLKTVLNSIQNCLSELCGGSGHAPIRNNSGKDSSGSGSSSPTNVQNISLAGSFNEPILYQNTPNPFSTGTSINYFLPEGTMGAKMLFFDSYGKQLKSVDLSQTPGSPQASGNGTLNITPDNLQSGIYSYSLVVDNKVIDTKRMVLQK